MQTWDSFASQKTTEFLKWGVAWYLEGCMQTVRETRRVKGAVDLAGERRESKLQRREETE